MNATAPMWKCLEHGTEQQIGETCREIARGHCRDCGHHRRDHYAAKTYGGSAITGCSDETSGGPYGEYNVPCECSRFNGDESAVVTTCRY